MRTITVEESEIAMTAGLMKTNQPVKPAIEKIADLDNLPELSSAAEVGCAGWRHPLGLYLSPCTESKSVT